MFYALCKPEDWEGDEYTTVAACRAKTDAIANCKAFINKAFLEGNGPYIGVVCKGSSKKTNPVVWDSQKDD